MNDPLRVAREGPFWASMFVLLGAVVGFGGTIEVRISFASQRQYMRNGKYCMNAAGNRLLITIVHQKNEFNRIFNNVRNMKAAVN